jgi:hypothetical protein
MSIDSTVSPTDGAPGPTPNRTTDRRSLGRIVKMLGFVTEGIGIVVSGLSVHFLLELVGSAASLSIYTNLFDTLEAGVILAGLGVILIGLGYYLEPLPDG